MRTHHGCLPAAWPVAIFGTALLLCCAGGAAAADSDTSASSKSSDWASTSDGWKKDRIFYQLGNAGPPVGRWDDQFMNSFGAVAVGGAGWHTWSSLNKPGAAGWTGTYDSNPYPHVDTSAGGSTASNWTQIKLYREAQILGGGYFTIKWTKSNANAKRGVPADNPTVAATRITDPWDFSAPGSGNWSLGLDYSQFGDFSAAVPGASLWSSYGLTLNLSSGATRQYDLLSLTVGADGAALVRSDLNGNDAETSGALLPDQLNGVLLLNGQVVTAAQATTSLLAHYNAASGWSLNPDGHALSSFEPDNPLHTASVFSLSARVFFDPSTTGLSLGTDDGSSVLSAVPESGNWALMLVGLAGLLVRSRRVAARGRITCPSCPSAR